MRKIFTYLLVFCSISTQVAAQSDNTTRPVAKGKQKNWHTILPEIYVGVQSGFMYSGVEWGKSQIKPVELVNTLLQDELQRSSSGVISTEKRPTYGHPYALAELGFHSSFYQVFAYGGSGKFYQDAKNFSRIGLGVGANLPIGHMFDLYGNFQIEKDNSMNGMNLITLKYDDSLSDKKRAAAEELIMCYKDPNCTGAGFVTSQTSQYYALGARFKKKFFRQRGMIYIGAQYLQSIRVTEDAETSTTVTMNGGINFNF